MSTTESISDRLRRLRKAAGMSQDNLAERAGLTRVAIYRFEAGTREPAWETLQKLASALGASLGDFDGCTSSS